MTSAPLDLVLVSTPIGALGSGRGGVELTLTSLLRGLAQRGHRLRLVAAEGSRLPEGCESVQLLTAAGCDQPSWQHAEADSGVMIPRHGLMPALWSKALQEADGADAVLNFGYDWLPLWITPHVCPPVFHLISMGSVASVMGDAVEALAAWDQRRLAFHTIRQGGRTFNCRARRVWSATVLTCRIIKSAWRRAVPWAGLDALPPKKGLRMPPLPPLPLGNAFWFGGFAKTTLMPMRWRLPCHRARSIGGVPADAGLAARTQTVPRLDQYTEVE